MMKLHRPLVAQDLENLVEAEGRVVRFKELPFACRCAYAYFLGECHELGWQMNEIKMGTWKFEKHLKILRKLPARDGIPAFNRGFKANVRNHVTKRNADHLVGHMHVSMVELVGLAYKENPGWYETRLIPLHPVQDPVMRWPVILDDMGASVPLVDGWHRLSRYKQLGYLKVPALYFVEQ